MNAVRVHDLFNIVSLFFICGLNLWYLYLTTDLSLLGTDEIGKNHVDLFLLTWKLFTAYVVVDTVWVILVPSCVIANPNLIIIHHFVTLVMTVVPIVHYKLFGWHFGACILVELNTFFLIARRNLTKGTFLYIVSDVFFYVTWVGLRLLLFPWLVVFYSSEYIRFSTAVNTYFNVVIITPVMHSVVTSLSLKWTFDMVMKLLKNDKKKEKSK